VKLKGEKLAINRLERALHLVHLATKSGSLLQDSINPDSRGKLDALIGAVIILQDVIAEQYRRLEIREKKDLWQQRLA